jgi:DNA gyrase subunit A
MGQTMRDEDEVHFFVRSNTLATLLFFTDKGKVYSERVYELPKKAAGQGIALVNIINLEPMKPSLRCSPYRISAGKLCTMATRRGASSALPGRICQCAPVRAYRH